MNLTYTHAGESHTAEGHRLLIEAARVTPAGWPFNVYVYRSRLENGEAVNPWTYGADSNCGLATERKAISAVISKLLDIAEMLNAGGKTAGAVAGGSEYLLPTATATAAATATATATATANSEHP